MPAGSSASRAGRPLFAVPHRHRLSMVLLGYIPFLHLSAVAAPLILPLLGFAPAEWAFLSLAVLYGAPPFVCRVAHRARPRPEGRFDPDSPEFLHWWFHAQWQVIFNRFPALEEALRMVPGLYSLWLRLWGSRVGALVFWSSGVTVLDRSYIEVGDRVIFGAGAVLSPHNLAPDASRRLRLLISTITVGRDTMVGGQAILAPGVRVAPQEMLPALERLAPYSEWKNGKRARRGPADWTTAATLVTPRLRPEEEEI